MRQITMAAVAVAAAALCATHAQAQTAKMQYQAIRLQMADVFKSTGCTVSAINATGWTVGQCLEGKNWIPSMWDPQGNQVVLATTTDAKDTLVTGINAGGELAGWYQDNNLQSHAMRWNASGQPAVLADSGVSFASGIDDSGNVVGDDFGRAAVWHTNGSLVHLAPPAGAVNTYAISINAFGTVLGQATFPASGGGGYSLPVMWKRQQPTIIDPGHLAGYVSATAINDQGVAIGRDQALFGNAYEWKGTGSTLTLPRLAGGTGAAALALNDNVIVGSALDGSDVSYAVKWIHGAIQKLQPVTVMPRSLTGGTLATANAINAGGSIAAVYVSANAPINRPVILVPFAPAAD